MKNYFLLLLTFIFWNCQKTTPQLTLVFADPDRQFTGVAVSKEGRVFVNYPYWDSVHSLSVAEIIEGKAYPYPDASMNDWQLGQATKGKWICVQALYIDEENTLWVVDPAAPFLNKVIDHAYQLVAIDLSSNTIKKRYDFEGKIGEDSYINDVRIDLKNQFAYLTNSKTGGIITIDLQTGETYERMQNHFSVLSDPDYHFSPNSKLFQNAAGEVQVHSDGLTLSKDAEFLYYKPLTDDKLYRIPTSWLRLNPHNRSLPAVEDLGNISTSDGLFTGENDEIYMGDLENNAIVIYDPLTQQKKTLIQDSRLQWPDSFGFFDGYLYVACSQIHLQPAFNGGSSKRDQPYQLFKIKL